MHICLTIDYSPWSFYSGGAQRSTHNIALGMVRRGHKVSVIYSKPPWESIKIPINLPYTIHWANLYALKSKRAAFFRPLTTLSVNRILKRIIQKDEKTIVHSNGEEGGLIHRLRSRYKFGFISTPRHPHYPDVFFKYNRLPFTVKVFTALKEGKYLLQGSAAFHADFCSPPSHWSARMLNKAFNVPEDKLRPVPNGVPMEFLNYYRKPGAENGPIVFFGRLSKTKGVDTLVESFKKIDPNKLPMCRVIGRGDLKSVLKKKVQQFNLSDKITFEPWMTHDELGEALSECSICVLPSREENFSLAILGAMCTGAPTISTKVGGTPEIIKNNENGLLVPPGDANALAHVITNLLNHPDKQIKLGSAGANYIRNNLTWEDTCRKFEDLYQQAWEKEDQRWTKMSR